MTEVIDQRTAEGDGVSHAAFKRAREVLFRVGSRGSFSPVARDMTNYECNTFHCYCTALFLRRGKH